jgi:hypothetical protein
MRMRTFAKLADGAGCHELEQWLGSQRGVLTRTHVHDDIDVLQPQQLGGDPRTHATGASRSAKRAFRHVAGVGVCVISDIRMFGGELTEERARNLVLVPRSGRKRTDLACQLFLRWR